MEFPAGLRYTKEHEWIRVEGDQAYVGITDYAASQLGDLVFIELPAVGTKLQKGAAAAVVESVKAASEVFAPISGTVTEVNGALGDQPGDGPRRAMHRRQHPAAVRRRRADHAAPRLLGRRRRTVLQAATDRPATAEGLGCDLRAGLAARWRRAAAVVHAPPLAPVAAPVLEQRPERQAPRREARPHPRPFPRARSPRLPPPWPPSPPPPRRKSRTGSSLRS